MQSFCNMLGVGSDDFTGAFARHLVAPIVTTTCIILSSSNKIQNGGILTLANPSPPGK